MSRHNKRKGRNKSSRRNNTGQPEKRKMSNKNSEIKRSERRLELERDKRKKQDRIVLTLVIIVFLALTGTYLLMPMFSGGGNNTSPEPAIESPAPTASNDIQIPISDVNDGKAHYYTYNSDGVKIRYFLLKSSDGTIRTAFDTCDVCYGAKKGYRQEGDQMVCNNCGLKFDSNKINEVKGGCNPAPLTRQIDGSDLVINIDDLEKGRWYFE